jgi:nicotinamide-nucleotide amidase
MITEILATGDEIRTGALVDTNSAHIAEKLEESGMTVKRHITVGDSMDALVAVLQEISRRAELAVVTGGLGPTGDDLTAEAAARAAKVPLVLNAEARVSMEAYFKRHGKPLPSADNRQMHLPETAVCLENTVGSAPGFCLTIHHCTFYFLPGVPREMHEMLSRQVLPRIGRQLGDKGDVHQIRSVCTFGLPESEINRRLLDFPEHFPDLQLGLRAAFPEVQVKVYGRGVDHRQLGERLTAAVSWIARQIGRPVFSLFGHSMEAEVGRLLVNRRATLAVAESCTGGLIANRLTEVPGCSEYFLFSGVTYANQAKINVLGVLPETLATYGAVHEDTVKQMAEGARRISGADYAVATSGIAGPTGGSPDKPVGTVCIGLATPEGVTGHRYHFTFGDRAMNKQMFAMMALELLRRELLRTDTS